MDAAERIERAATELFSEHGLEGVSLRDIARRAEVTVGSVNYYFGSKDALYRHCLFALARQYFDEGWAKLSGPDGPHAVFEHYQTFTDANPRLVRFWLDLQWARDPELRGYSNREMMAPTWKLLTEAASRTGPVTTERRLMILSFIGAVILRTLMRDDQLEELVEGAAQGTREGWHDLLASGIERLLLSPGVQVSGGVARKRSPDPKLNGAQREGASK